MLYSCRSGLMNTSVLPTFLEKASRPSMSMKVQRMSAMLLISS